MIFLKDADELRFVRFNRAGEDLIGFSRDDLIGKNDYDFFPSDEADAFTAKDREVLATRELVDIPEEPIHTRGRGTRYLHTKKIPIVDAGDRPRFLLGISEDITERKDREEEARRRVEEITRINRGMANLLEDLQAANRKLVAVSNSLREANEELGSFSYSVSHDLRAPLRAVHGFASALLEDYGDQLDEGGRRFLDRILQNATDMGALIDDLLAFSRVSRQPLTSGPIDMRALVEDTIQELQPAGGTEDLDVRVAELPSARGDASLVRRIWQNLLSNAVKFTRPGVAPVIEVGSTMDENAHAYYVKDNGVGFEMEYAKRIFAVFQRLHSTQDYEGTGVGLAIVERIVRRHGGRVWAEATPGEGATFYFTLTGSEGSNS
jgi:PAS domain S-box-containing protein